MHPGLRERLRCPADKHELTDVDGGARLVCPQGHEFFVVNDIPVMLLSEWLPTDPEYKRSLDRIADTNDPMMSAPIPQGNTVDPVVQWAIGGSCGNMYKKAISNLRRYPIPRLRLPDGNGRWLLDIGCAWGRWSHSAARRGWHPVGIDPLLRNALAATRIAQQLGHQASFVVADGRYLPFAEHSFDAVFSYSVLQHLSKDDVKSILREVRRVLTVAGESLIEMANVYGLRSRMVEWQRNHREPVNNEVRYWRPEELAETFSREIGPTRLSVDGFFCLNPQLSDLDLLPLQFKALVISSEILRKLSGFVPGLKYMADSVYLRSTPRANLNV
jgi:2-polyprenyl-3-methyl-5-hydroxy-6-metoxy-1,4-benzoquinol methylase/uncharacterized protein YbaR (Trm112 family)